MKRMVFLLTCMLMGTMMVQAQLLFSISGNGLDKPSYVLGTYHFASSSFSKEIPGFSKAMAEVDQVCGEVIMEDMMKPENLMKMQKAMMLPDGQKLQQILSKEEMDALNALMKQLLGADLSNPAVGAQMGQFTPAALLVQLTSLLYLKKDPTFNVNDGIDTYVQTQAKKDGKGVLGLETIDYQIKVLLQGQTLERQKQLLNCFIEHQDYYLQQTESIVKAYYSKDLEGIESMEEKNLGDGCDSTDEEDELLVYGRNADWIAQMPAIMKEKPTLFAVGAAHLVGEKGVLHLLRQAGYEVTPMN